MRFDDWDRFPRFAPSVPRTVKGGIKAASERGQFGESWWAKRWISALQHFNIPSRLQRGRSYARKGQVISIDVKKGLVEARVQGSRAQPYEVRIEVRALSAAEWKRIVEQLGTQAIFAAKLLTGEMPPAIEQAFEAAGLSLFPETGSAMSTECSCPDWSNPCKHIAAVYYLMGEAFDRDPFLIFKMRGMERDEFLQALGKVGLTEEAPPPIAESLPTDAAEFWQAKPLPSNLPGEAVASRTIAALPRRLGNLPFWRGEVTLLKALDPLYQSAAERAERLLWGERDPANATALRKPEGTPLHRVE